MFSRFGMVILLCVSAHLAVAQAWQEKVTGPWNFAVIQQQMNAYFADSEEKQAAEMGQTDNEYIRYKRWENFWKSRVLADGSFPDPSEKWEIYKQLQNNQKKNVRGSDWRNINQIVSASGYHGMGRCITVAFHPSDTNILYVGAEQGGIWKSADMGNTWTPLGDNLPWAGVGNIVVNHQNPDHLYITIGLNEGWWHFGLGIYKSTDGGLNWFPTTRTTSFTDENVYYKMRMHPVDTSVLFSAEEDGLFKSVDAGQTWTQVISKPTIDFEFKPFDPQTMYASCKGSNGKVYKSTDQGNTWTEILGFSINNTCELDVTKDDPDFLGIATENSNSKDLYLSYNAGDSVFFQASGLDDNTMFIISDLNKNRMYNGYVSNHRSLNQGIGWTQITNWYNDGVLTPVHADNHLAVKHPLLSHYIFFTNDGGLYRHNELSGQWKDLSDGLVVTEYYRLACSQLDSVYIIGGTQDNGGRQRIQSPNIWTNTNGGDAMEVAVDPDNDWTIYTEYWGGKMYRSYDRWDQDTYYDIMPDSNRGAWVTPYMLDPLNPFKMYAAFNDVWYSTDQGDTWTTLSNILTNSISNKLEVLDVAPTNTNYIYTGRLNTLYYTSNFGSSWTTHLVPKVNGTFEDITYLVVSPWDENTVYITKGGYGNLSKVYKSTDNGDNWVNVSYNLPNIPANCILIDKQSDSMNCDIYLGTDVGVFYKKDSDTAWQVFGTGMPHTEVSDLDIFYPTRKLRAATYGRGIWETDCALLAPLPIREHTDIHANIYLRGNIVEDKLWVVMNNESMTTYRMEIVDVNGRVVQSFTIQSEAGIEEYSMDISTLSSGNYIVKVSGEHVKKVLRFTKK